MADEIILPVVLCDMGWGYCLNVQTLRLDVLRKRSLTRKIDFDSDKKNKLKKEVSLVGVIKGWPRGLLRVLSPQGVPLGVPSGWHLTDFGYPMDACAKVG